MDALSARFRAASDSLLRSEQNIRSAIARTWWVGPAANNFRAGWQSVHGPRMRGVATRLSALDRQLSTNRSDQTSASSVSGVAGAPDRVSGSAGAATLGVEGSGSDLRSPDYLGWRGYGTTLRHRAGVEVDLETRRLRPWSFTDKTSGDLDSVSLTRSGLTGDGRLRTEDKAEYERESKVEKSIVLGRYGNDDVEGFFREKAGGTVIGGVALSGSASVLAGSRRTIEGSAEITDGNFVAKGSLGGSLGVGVEARGSAKMGVAEVAIQGGAFVGAEAAARGKVQIGKNGLGAELGVSGFVGARADVDGSVSLAGVTAKAGVGVSYGIGGHADVGGEVSLEKVRAKVDLGATIGLGIQVKFDVEIEPIKVFKAVKFWD